MIYRPRFLRSFLLFAVYWRHFHTAGSVVNPSWPGNGVYTNCATGFFPCNSTDQCVLQRQNCDGKVDCSDGSDEWGCEDKYRKDFWNSYFRKRPDEDREKKGMEGCALHLVPEECTCSGHDLYCEHRDLKRVPFPISGKITLLDLSGSHIESLSSSDFPKLDLLTTLVLTAANVKIIHAGAFQNLPNLQILNLIGNKITEIKNNTFLVSTELRSLVISHNPLVELDQSSFQGLENLQELDLRNCRVEFLPPGVLDPLVSLEKLLLDGNRLIELSELSFERLSNLVHLSLSNNSFYRIEGSWLNGLSQLQFLSFSNNKIDQLDDYSFGNLTHLRNLEMQGNKIQLASVKAFEGLNHLNTLNYKGNPVHKLEQGVFAPLKELQYVYFDEFSYCSHAMHVRVCVPHGDGISSVEHLLDNVLLRVSVWIVAVLAVLGNAIVLLGRLLVKEPNEVHSFYIKNLALADLVMGIYLFLIAGYDVAFRGEYIQHEEKWRHSWQCNFSGFLSTTSTEASVFILTLITMDRYTSIVYPLSVKRRTMRFAGVCTGIMWFLAVLFSALPLLDISYYGNEFYGNNGVCLPLHIHKPFNQAWEYSTFMFCGVNMAAFFFIFFAYISMFFTISSSRIGLRSTQHHQQQDKAIAKRFAFIVATDFLCWVPIVIIKILAMAGVPIDAQLNAWVAVFLLPVNSALNPILYTLTTKLFKQQIRRIVYSCRDGVQPFSRSDPFRLSRSSRSSKKTVVAVFSMDVRKLLLIQVTLKSYGQDRQQQQLEIGADGEHLTGEQCEESRQQTKQL